jgi:PAS domain S-box-containing protein
MSTVVSSSPMTSTEKQPLISAADGQPRGSASENHTDLIDFDLIDFVENATVGLHRVGQDGTILWANQAELDLVGCTRDEYIGHHIAEFHADASVIQDILARLSRGETLRNYEARLRRKDGSIRHVLIDSNVRFDNGEFVHTRCFTRDITERKQAEEALRESEERFRALFNLGPVAVYSIDTAGVIQNFNRRAAELWGREPALGDTDKRFGGSHKLFRPDGSFMPHDQCPMAEVVSGRMPEAHDAEVLIERPDGSRVTVIVNIRPLKNDRGEVIGAINCFYDITERKQEEEANSRLAAIVESSDDAIIGKDLNGMITSWNRGAQRIFGFTAQEAVGQPVTLLMPPDRLDEEPGILQRIRGGEFIEHYETVRRHKNGTLLNISLSVSPVKDANGKIIGASKIARDITERKQAEEALQESEERFRTLHDALPVAAFVCDRNAVIQLYNRRAVELWGREPAIGVERHCGSVKLWLTNGTQLPHEQSPMIEVLRTGLPARNVEVFIERPDGLKLPVIVNFCPLRNARGEIDGVVTTFDDISDRKRAEETQRRAEQLAASAEIAASLAHEINNPLQSLTNLVALISYQLADDKTGSSIAGMANKELKRIAHITKHMLALRRDTLTPASLNLTEILDDALEFLTPELVVKHIEVERRYECSRHIEGFPGEMRQLFTCLIANAAEARPTKITIHVSSSRNWKSGGENIRVVIADNGTGIAPNLVTQIFDPFATTKERRGAGLGLWVVNNIVTRHRGRIRLRTSARPGQAGTSFAVFLPQKAEQVQFNSQADVSKTAA